MTFAGIEKLSLVDYDGYSACTVFTAGCNLRCPFCQNASLVRPGTAPAPIPEAEVIAYLIRRRGLIDALCVTGGEPTLHPGLTDFLRAVRAALPDLKIKLDTNGTRPAVMETLITERLLDYVAMDIKNRREQYAETAGCALHIGDIERSVEILRASTGIGYEFRTTVVAEYHTEADMVGIGEWLRDTPRFYLQQFRDRGTNLKSGLCAPSDETLRHFRDILLPYIPAARIRGEF